MVTAWCCAIIRSGRGTGSTAALLNLHGHSHGRLKALPRQHDVGVDPRGFAPVRLDQLLGKG